MQAQAREPFFFSVRAKPQAQKLKTQTQVTSFFSACKARIWSIPSSLSATQQHPPNFSLDPQLSLPDLFSTSPSFSRRHLHFSSPYRSNPNKKEALPTDVEVEIRNLGGSSSSFWGPVLEAKEEEEDFQPSQPVPEQFEEEELKPMKDHINLDSQTKKRDLKEIAGSFWSAASVFSKKLQKWRQKQKLKKRRNVPVGGGCRKGKRTKGGSSSASASWTVQPQPSQRGRGQAWEEEDPAPFLLQVLRSRQTFSPSPSDSVPEEQISAYLSRIKRGSLAQILWLHA